MTGTGRVNIVIPLETMILIEKECDRRGIKRTQFIQEAISEKLKSNEQTSDILYIKDTVQELKGIMRLILEK